MDDLEEFIIVLQRITGKETNYTEFLLCTSLYKFPSAYLITENHKHIPSSLFEREYTITIDTEKDIRNYGIYRISIDKFNKAAENILRGKDVIDDLKHS